MNGLAHTDCDATQGYDAIPATPFPLLCGWRRGLPGPCGGRRLHKGPVNQSAFHRIAKRNARRKALGS